MKGSMIGTSAMRVGLSGLLVLALAACASVTPRERLADRLAEYEAVAGAPVDSFHFLSMHSWELLGPQEVAVWTRINDAWLIRVDRPCNGLEFTAAIGVSSTASRVTRRFDYVEFENQRCRIDEIRPVDGKALKALRRERRAQPA